MIEIRLDAPDLPRIERWPQQLRWGVSRLIARETEEAARDFKAEMANQGMAATSLMINSVKADKIDDLSWRAGPHVGYARYVLEGRRPGAKMPPWRSIADWLRVKHLDSSPRAAWAVARAIRRRGIKARDFATPVLKRTQTRLIERGPAAISAALNGGGDVG